MIKKIVFCLIVGLFTIVPLKSLAADKLEPPNLVETRIDGQFIDKTKVSIGHDKVLVLQGTAKPGSEVFLYIYSTKEPLVSQVKVDEKGDWLYDLTQVLPAGKHRIEGETHADGAISAKVELLKFNVPREVITGVSNWITVLGLILILAIGAITYYLLRRRSLYLGKK